MRATDLIGRTVGNYTIVRRLGSGGMGEVYEAQQPAIGARVAIKVLNADATDPASAQRFLIEAQAVNRINHDGVVKIIDAGYTNDDRPYLVMEFLDGASLAEVMKAANRLPMGSACKVVADVLAVLASAHDEGIVHRDLKPHNVFLTRTGRTVVLDFGVAKLLDTGGSVSLTLTGAILGTPAYMAPEQIQGETIDGRADLYAVGVVLYELVTGRRPFDGDQTYDLLTAHVERRPPPPRAIRPDVPLEVQAVLMSALAKDRDDRFQTADAMRAALLQAAALLPPDAFAAITLPGAPARRTPTIPPTGSGPVAAASVELAATTVRSGREAGPPGSMTRGPMPVRGDRASGPARQASDAAGADVTIRGKTGPAVRAARLATAPTAAAPTVGPDPLAVTDPEAARDHGLEHSLPTKRDAPSPPPGASTMVPRSRKPVVIAALALGAAAIAGAFAIGRLVGSRDAQPGSSTAVGGTGSAVVADAAGLATAADAGGPPASIPKELEQRLFRRRLHVLDLRPEIVDLLRTAAENSGAAAGQLPAMLPQILSEVDRVVIDMDLVAAKALRVQDLSLVRATTMPPGSGQAIGEALNRALRALDHGDAVLANGFLWRAEWMLEHGGKPP